MVPLIDPGQIIPACLAEVIGTFILAMMVLINTEKETRFSSVHWVTAILIGLSLSSAIYTAASVSNAVFNPQIGIGLQLTALIQGGSYDPYFKDFYVYLAFPVVGAILAVVFFEFFYKTALKHSEEDVPEDRINLTTSQMGY